jgi:hypothetical protein
MDDILIVLPDIKRNAMPLQNLETRLYALDGRRAEVREDSEDGASCSEEIPPANSSEDFYNKYVARTRQECAEELSAPQRSSGWHRARKYALTASNFGSAAGHNPYCSPLDCAREKLNPSKTNDAMRYGNANEPVARDALLKILEKQLWPTLEEFYGSGLDGFEHIECGLLKYADQPWLAASPDGLLKLFGESGIVWILLEYKCPTRQTSTHPYSKNWSNIPPYYYDQIQGIMGLMSKHDRIVKSSLFVVWQPERLFVTRCDYEDGYFKDLELKLKDWYFNTFLSLIVKPNIGWSV